MAYGCTCGAVLIRDDSLVLLVIGDPDIVVFAADGKTYFPTARGGKSGTEVDSLCGYNAVEETAAYYLPWTDRQPRLRCR